MSEADGAQVAALARGWIGTPYHHQASTKGAGADCLGLLRGVWRELFGDEPLPVPPYSRDWGEVGGREVLLEALGELMPRNVWALRAGRIVVFRMRDGSVCKHAGILTGPDTFVHSTERLGVVEARLTATWQRRIARVFAFPQGD